MGLSVYLASRSSSLRICVFACTARATAGPAPACGQDPKEQGRCMSWKCPRNARAAADVVKLMNAYPKQRPSLCRMGRYKKSTSSRQRCASRRLHNMSRVKILGMLRSTIEVCPHISDERAGPVLALSELGIAGSAHLPRG